MKYQDITKIDRIKLSNSKLLKINCIKNRIYKKNHYLKNICIEDLEIRLKKALYIIYLYCIHNKRILFVGSSLETHKNIKKLLKNTRHSIVPELGWIPGIITNKRTTIRSLLLLLFNENKTNIFNLAKNLINIKNHTDLIVILDEQKNETALYEGYLSHIPVISLNDDSLNLSNIYSSYKVPGNFYFNKKIPQNNVFLFLLTSILKKALITKIKNPSIIDYKLRTINKFKNAKYNRYPYKKFKKKKYYKKKFNKKWQKKDSY